MIPRLEVEGGRVVVRRGKAVGKRVRQYRTEAERSAGEPWRKEGYGAEYKHERERALESTGGRCAACGKKIADKADGRWKMNGGEVHHSVPLAEGGSGPLVPLCISCHRKADAELRRARRGGGSK